MHDLVRGKMTENIWMCSKVSWVSFVDWSRYGSSRCCWGVGKVVVMCSLWDGRSWSPYLGGYWDVVGRQWEWLSSDVATLLLRCFSSSSGDQQPQGGRLYFLNKHKNTSQWQLANGRVTISRAPLHFTPRTVSYQTGRKQQEPRPLVGTMGVALFCYD